MKKIIKWVFICLTSLLNKFSCITKNIVIENHGSVCFRNTYKVKGKNNRIVFMAGGLIYKLHVHIHGDNNLIIFKDSCHAKSTEICIEDSNNRVEIGENTHLCGEVSISCIEGTNVIIGSDCLFSSNIMIRTGDSHSIVDSNGNRTNKSKSVAIGNHVWVCNSVIITKGVSIPNNCIVGSGSVVTKKVSLNNSIIAGNPADVVRTNINWVDKRL